MKNKFIFLILIFCCFSCKHSENKRIKNTDRLINSINVKFDTIKFKINNSQLSYYPLTTYNGQNGNLYCYNDTHHTIDVYSIKDKILKKIIPLVKEGPNGIERPNDILITESNELYAIGYFDISNIDENGNIIERKSINSKSRDSYFSKHFFFPSKDSGFEYHKESDQYYIINTNMQYDISSQKKDFFKNSKLIGSYSMLEEQPRELDISYPSEYLELDFGFNSIPFTTIYDDKIYYLVSSLPHIYTYDIKTHEIYKADTSTDGLPHLKMNYNKIANELSINERLNTYMLNSNFGPIYVNQNFIARVYQSATPESKIGINDSNVKENMLQVFDKNFNLIKNISLDFAITFAGIFMDESSIYFQLPPDTEEYLSFLRIDLIANL